MLLGDLGLTFDPAWPWSLPGIGLTGLACAAGLLALLTVWTYLGAKGMTGRRLTLILVLRLGALAVAYGESARDLMGTHGRVAALWLVALIMLAVVARWLWTRRRSGATA